MVQDKRLVVLQEKAAKGNAVAQNEVLPTPSYSCPVTRRVRAAFADTQSQTLCVPASDSVPAQCWSTLLLHIVVFVDFA